jgi:UDP-N-acetylmuramoyl-tripeptide--D-alanyl-D-alanine ligase
MKPLPLTVIRQAVGLPCGSESTHFDTVCTDSRQARPGATFFALAGEHTDGHNYAANALAAGAAAVVRRGWATEPMRETYGARILEVENPLIALGELAAYYRDTCLSGVRFIGVTGSVGKTSTREMITSILRQNPNWHIASSEKNYNNEIGVPLTLLQLSEGTHTAVVEMGMRAEGEILYLANIVKPQIAVITSIGHAHIEILGSQEAIARAKSEIALPLLPGSTVIMPEDVPFRDLIEARLPAGVQLLLVGPNSGNMWAETTEPGAFRLHLNATEVSPEIRIPVPGTHHMRNAEIAAATAIAAGSSLDTCADALNTWQGAAGRMSIKHAANGATILDDCYNASPESMWAAMRTLAQTAVIGRRIAVIGDMRELGEFGPKLHKELAAVAADSGLQTLVTVGALGAMTADALDQIQQANAPWHPVDIVRTDNWKDCAGKIGPLVGPQDTVLIKGSRALELEHVVAALTGEESATHG